MRLFLMSLIIVLTFGACANKNVDTSNVANTKNVEIEQDDFSNEYAQEKEVFDPLSGYNRTMTSFNDGFYEYVLDPVARGYAYVVPEVARKGVSNVFDNLMFPIRFVNNVLQLKFQNASEELGRFMMNSTFGLLGLMDVASEHTSWEEHKEDFGQTLGHYGVGSGFHVVLPFFGPSNLRDVVGMSVDSFADPTMSTQRDWKIPDNLEKSIGLKTLNVTNQTSLHLGAYENIKKDAIDLYPFLRDIYEQKRITEIKE